MSARNRWIAVIALCCAGLLVGGLVLTAAKPGANAPIVLHYGESPIFLGPHEQWVTAIAFSPDGKTLATGAGDGRLRLWDCATGRLKSILGDDANRGSHGLAFSPDGRLLAAVGALFGDDVVIWDIASGRIARRFQQEVDSADAAAAASAGNAMIYKEKPIVYRVLHAIAFSPDGTLLATAGDHVVLRDAESGNIRATLEHPGKGVHGLAFSPDGKTLATAANDKKVRLWNVPAGELKATLDGPTQSLGGVALSPDGTRIVASSSGNRSIFNRTPVGYLWAWERPSGAPRKIELGNAQVGQVAFVGPAKVIVAAGRELLSVDLDGGNTPRKIGSHSGDVLAVAVSPDHRLVASGGKDRAVDIVDLSTEKLVHRLPGLTDIVSSVAISHDGQRFATATMDQRFSYRLPDDETSFAARYKKYFSAVGDPGGPQAGELRVWSTRDGRLQTMLPLPASQLTAIEFIPRSDQIAVAGWVSGEGGMVSVWDVSNGKKLRDFDGHANEVLSIAVSPDGRTLAGGDVDGNFDLWDVQSGTKTRSHKHDHPVEAVAFSADGKLLATGDGNRTVRIFDASGGTIVRTLSSRSYIKSLKFSPDGNVLAAGTRDPGMELWDLRANTASRTLKAHDESSGGFVAFSPDGRFIVCGGHGKDIAVFDAATATLQSELRGHAHAPTAAAFLSDGRLVSAGEERTLMLWDVNHPQRLATWVVVPADPKQGWSDEWVGFRPSGQFVSSARSERLVGWLTGGDVINSPEDANRRRRVESLFPTDPVVSRAK